MQEYRPVSVYINGSYYGILNMREKLNSDYVESKFDVNKDEVSVIKYSTATHGTTKDYNQLINYINSHNTQDKNVYEYLESQIDIQELINYWIVESFYGNTDLGNIRYFKSNNGKWRFMLYDLDWSLWNMNLDISYPTRYGSVPAATYLSSSINMVRKLYQNSEFKKQYLTSLGKYLKTTFKPERVNEIIDELVSEIKDEMPRHINRWKGSYPNLNSMDAWMRNINNFKNTYRKRYESVLRNLKSNFKLSNSEYEEYFGGLS